MLNVARYITFRTAAASLTALVISLVLGPWLIRRLREFQIGQVIRQEGPQSHQAKAGTPTMGGLLILAAALVPTLLWADLTNVYVWIAVLATAAFGAHRLPRRLPEDHAPIVGRAARRATRWACRSSSRSLVGLALMWLAAQNLYNTRLIFPFFKQLIPDLGWFYVPFAVFVLVGGATPSTSPTGSTGSRSAPSRSPPRRSPRSPTSPATRVFAEYLLLVHFAPAGELTIFCGALVGASLGFLWYNAHPAEIFMGDVGSLALGGALGTVAILIKQELLLVLVGGVFVLEARR